MATTITGSGPFKTVRVDLGATAAKVEAITLPRWAREVEVSVYASDNTTATAGTFSSSGTDGADPDASAIRIDSAERKFFGFAPSESAVLIYVSADVINAVAHVRVTS
jgi:hypothetical protein